MQNPKVDSPHRDPSTSLDGCERIVFVGRTGSGKTTLARRLSEVRGVDHIELDALYFGPGFSTVPLDVLRERTSRALVGDRWVTDGNKSSVRDLVWPRADTIVWLDYPLVVSLWRLAGRGRKRSSSLRADSAGHGSTAWPKQFVTGARGVATALRSHRGQRRTYPVLFAAPENRHLAVVRLQSPRAATRWLAQVAGVEVQGD